MAKKVPKVPDDPRRFLDPGTIARISQLDLRAKQIVEGFISGMHRSPFFGHSIEFVQHRDYTAGDDIRHLDWKVWSKTDRYVIKQYEEETNLRCHLVVDVSNSMHYGNGPLNKYEYASTIAACLSYMILRQQDSAGIMTFDSDVRQVIPSRSQQTHIDTIVKALHVSRPRDKTDIEKILKRVAENAPSRGMIIIVSDLLCDREPLFRGLDMLAHGRHDILIFHVLDSEEMTFPFAGTTKFEGMEDLDEIVCDPRALRDGYLEALEEYLVEVRRGCARRGIDYQLIHTQEHIDAVLSKFLHHREALFRSSAKR
ncbi:MAG: DUF58 domain-containing protein [Gemmataceae bacterium]|nr:DUF58 domain-containing protein [Gemmataceae bacterium]